MQRQMKARRELERRRDEKHLKALIDDEWLLDQGHSELTVPALE